MSTGAHLFYCSTPVPFVADVLQSGLMPSPETEGGPEKSSEPFCIVSKFQAEPVSRRAYFTAQSTIKKHWDNDLSVYRFQLSGVFHVAVLGLTPPVPLEQQLRLILATGDPATLPENIVALLFARKIQASQHGPWIERHYRERKQ